MTISFPHTQSNALDGRLTRVHKNKTPHFKLFWSVYESYIITKYISFDFLKIFHFEADEIHFSQSKLVSEMPNFDIY